MAEPFKLKGMTFKGDTPFKTINFSKLGERMKSSKFGQTKLGEALSSVAGEIGGIQEKFIASKKSLGLKTPGYDATVENEQN